MSIQDRDYMKANYRTPKRKFVLSDIHNKFLFLLWLIKRRLFKSAKTVQNERLNVPPHSKASESKSSNTSPHSANT
jgi:hypothetical protein